MAARDPRLDAYVRLFNDGAYWESHEALEPLWLETAPPRRELYRGLIQAAAAMVHHERHNAHGVRVLGGKAKARLVAFVPVADGLDLTRFIFDWERCLYRGGPPPRLHEAARVSS